MSAAVASPPTTRSGSRSPASPGRRAAATPGGRLLSHLDACRGHGRPGRPRSRRDRTRDARLSTKAGERQPGAPGSRAGDLRAALRITAGPEGPAAKAYIWALSPPRHTRLEEFRVGVVLDDEHAPVSSEVAAPLSNAVDALDSAGATVVEGWPEGVDPGREYESFGFHVRMFFAVQQPGEDSAELSEFIEQPLSGPWGLAPRGPSGLAPQDEVEGQGVPDLVGSDVFGPVCGAGLVPLETADQGGLDAEDGVALQEAAAVVEDVGGHRPEARRPDDEVQMGGSPRVPAGCAQHLADGPVVRDGIVGGPHAEEGVAAVVGGPEQASQVRL